MGGPTCHDYDSEAATVILLHGAPRKGKSMMARYMHWYYENEKLDSFSKVFYLECGPTASGPGKQLELLRRLSYEKDVAGAVQQLDLLQKLRGEQDVKSPQNAGFEIISTRLALEFSRRRGQMLIIMDDVSKGELVQNIVKLCEGGVTFLVTSRFHDMCKGMTNLSCITMEDVGDEDAMKILAGHLNFKAHHIPSHFQSIARRKTDSNPLALASLAAAIGDSKEASDWEWTCRAVFDSLRSKPKMLILGV